MQRIYKDKSNIRAPHLLYKRVTLTPPTQPFVVEGGVEVDITVGRMGHEEESENNFYTSSCNNLSHKACLT